MPLKFNFFKQAVIKYQTLLLCLLLIAATLSVYAQVREFDFINYDDDDYVTENPFIREGLTLEAAKWAFTSPHAGNWHPLTWVSHMIDIQFFGMHAGVHHVINLLFHIANTLILFLVFVKMTGSRGKSAFVAALFALHPLHVESVAWVSERKDVLCAFFWLLAMGAYAGYARRPSMIRYAGVSVLYICGLLSKSMVVTLPCVFLLLDYWPLNRVQFRKASDAAQAGEKSAVLWVLLEKIPLFVFAVLSSWATIYAQKQGGAVVGLETIPVIERMANALVAYVGYIQKMLLPIDLGVIYPHQRLFAWWEIAGAALLLLAVTGLAVRASNRHPWFPVGWFWFLGTLVPVIGIVQVGSQAMADRYTYLPSIGLFVAVAWGIPKLMEGRRFSQILTGVGVIMVLMVLTGLTWRQVGFWKNSRMLFEHTLAVTSDNYTAHNNLGEALYHQGDIDKALFHNRRSVEINPDYAKGHFNLGVLLEQTGDREAAIHHYLEAVRVHPGFDKAHFNLAVLMEAGGKEDDAARHYLEVIQVNPHYYQAYNNMGAIQLKKGRVMEAIDYFQKAVEINPGYAKARFSLGLAFSRIRNYVQSVRNYQKALELDPDFEVARNNLCVALFQGGNIPAAMACFKEALELNPGNTTARGNYEQALEVVGDGGK
jgi:tetratricopeptide (TPR) repeat protein